MCVHYPWQRFSEFAVMLQSRASCDADLNSGKFLTQPIKRASSFQMCASSTREDNKRLRGFLKPNSLKFLRLNRTSNIWDLTILTHLTGCRLRNTTSNLSVLIFGFSRKHSNFANLVSSRKTLVLCTMKSSISYAIPWCAFLLPSWGKPTLPSHVFKA